jgi:hypothetical protein
MHCSQHALALLLAVPCLCAPLAAQSVLTVKPDGSADFLTIQAAVDASSPGDVIVVSGGLHENVLVTHGLTLLSPTTAGIGKAPAGPGAALPALRITGLAADEAVVLSGFTVFVGSGGAAAAVEVSDCAGAVWMQDVFVDSYGAPSLVADGAASVVVTNTLLQTNLVPALPDGTPQTAAGAEARNGTRLYGYDATAKGSHGTLQGFGNPVPAAPPDGGPGLLVTDASAHWSGGAIQGGSGNTLFLNGCLLGGDGGAGVLVQDGASPLPPVVTLSGTPLTGGFGAPVSACAPPTSPGPAIDAPAGTVTSTAAPARELTLPGLGAAGGSVTLGLHGAPGDAAFLLVALDAAPAFTAAQVDLHLSVDSLVAVVPFALPAGTLDVSVVLPALPAGLQALVVPLQAVFVDGQGGRHASNPRALVIL